MTFLIEPGALGSGVNFTSKVQTSDISKRSQTRTIPWSLQPFRRGLHNREAFKEEERRR